MTHRAGHRSLAEALRAYIAAAGIPDDRKGYLFRPTKLYDRTKERRTQDEVERVRL